METIECAGSVGFERGTIQEKKPDPARAGRYVYKVKSGTRNEIVSRWMEPVSAYALERLDLANEEIYYEYYTGDLVNYFMFPDGRGMILGKVRKDL